MIPTLTLLTLLLPSACPWPSAPVAHVTTANIGFGDFEAGYDYGYEVAPLSHVYWGGAPEPTAFTWPTQQRGTLVTAVVVDGRRVRRLQPWARYWTFYAESAPWGAEVVTWCGVPGYSAWLPVVQS